MGKCYLYGGGAAGLIRLIVKAATGSTVTCAKDDAVITAAEQDGRWTVDLQPGTWTVEVEKDGVTKSYTVDLQYSELIVGYELVLYDQGDNAEATGGWEVKTLSGYNLSQVSSTGVTNIKAQNGGTGLYVTKNAIDLSGYTRLLYKVGMGGVGTLNVVAIAPGATSVDEAAASAQVTDSTTNPTTVRELDISGVSGPHQIGLSLKTNSGNILNAYKAFMKLE